jgi:hypothetical protein
MDEDERETGAILLEFPGLLVLRYELSATLMLREFQVLNYFAFGQGIRACY